MRTRLLYRVFLLATLLIFSANIIRADSINYTYDELNRLVSIEKPDGYSIEYSYDAIGNRTVQVIQVMTPPYDYDKDGDVDGSDLADFCIEWDGSSETLEDFAGLFGSD